jgi:hypothetical protein
MIDSFSIKVSASRKRKEMSETELVEIGKVRIIEAEHEDEIAKYRAVKEVPWGSTTALSWWKIHESDYPILSRIAAQYLAIPASQACTERSFSLAGKITTIFVSAKVIRSNFIEGPKPTCTKTIRSLGCVETKSQGSTVH